MSRGRPVLSRLPSVTEINCPSSVHLPLGTNGSGPDPYPRDRTEPDVTFDRGTESGPGPRSGSRPEWASEFRVCCEGPRPTSSRNLVSDTGTPENLRKENPGRTLVYTPGPFHRDEGSPVPHTGTSLSLLTDVVNHSESLPDAAPGSGTPTSLPRAPVSWKA